jgi:thiamine pyrophosphate-dependent acetolactate synthase large subunit-like protein
MTAGESNSRGMPVVAGLQVLVDSRQDDQIVITNQGSARIWPKLSQHPLDFHYNPSTMGGAIPLALGLALGQPQRHVLVVSGDGALLMNLGALITVVGTGVTNLTIIVLDNGIYEVTGGQKTPAAGTPVDFPSFARAAGFPTALQFSDLSEWQTRAAGSLSLKGPRFIGLKVRPTPKEYYVGGTPSITDQLARLRRALEDRQAENR